MRPLRAPMTRKRKMREELLTHLVEVFDEEFAISKDERVALAATANRFGNPVEVGAELQKTIRFWDRPYLEELKWRPGESLLHFCGKMLLWSILCYVVFMSCLLVIA